MIGARETRQRTTKTSSRRGINLPHFSFMVSVPPLLMLIVTRAVYANRYIDFDMVG